MTIKVSDVKLQLNRSQYCFLNDISRSVWRVVEDDGSAGVETSLPAASVKSRSSSTLPSDRSAVSTVNLRPEIETVSTNGKRPWTSLDISLDIGLVKLHLYDETARWSSDLQTSGIARFALNDTRLRYKVLTDGATEAELILRSFTVTNTRSGSSRFREIIPAAKHNRNQFMILYTMSRGAEPSSLVVVTIDSPKIIFSVDPVFALLDFFSAANAGETLHLPDEPDKPPVKPKNQEANSTGVDFRIDLHDVIISVLETDTAADTQAIQLSIKQILLSRQVCLIQLTSNVSIPTPSDNSGSYG